LAEPGFLEQSQLAFSPASPTKRTKLNGNSAEPTGINVKAWLPLAWIEKASLEKKAAPIT
jgi:hypothetical protein